MSAATDSKSLAESNDRCRVALDAAVQIEALSNSLRLLVGSEDHEAAVLALADRFNRLGQAIICALDDPLTATEEMREMVSRAPAS